MNTFIAYNKYSKKILGFITNDYSKLEDMAEVFKEFENYDVVQTDVEVPNNFDEYKVVMGGGTFSGIERIGDD